MLVGQGGGRVFFRVWGAFIVLSNVGVGENPATPALARDGFSDIRQNEPKCPELHASDTYQ
jgi:hypothetical protein